MKYLLSKYFFLYINFNSNDNDYNRWMGFSSFFRYKNMKCIGRMAIVGPIHPPSLDDDPGALDGLAGEGEVADQGGVPVPTALQLGWFS